MPIQLGLRANWPQFALLVVVNAFVGGMVGLRYIRLARETARAVRVRLTRARRRRALAYLKAERAALYDAVMQLVGDLDLPGSVTPEGRVVPGATTSETRMGVSKFGWCETISLPSGVKVALPWGRSSS